MDEPLVPLWAMEWSARVLLGLWLFAVGASVGSFLNVVVYRLPAGLNLIWPSSHCPRCGHPIRPRDNIPILGWLLLAGRCRDCRSPISPRYIAVEIAVAIVFLSVAIAEYFLSRYLMTPVVGPHVRRLLTPFEPYPFWSAYVTHVTLATTLIGAALIEADGFRVPRRLYLPLTALALLVPVIWPDIRRIPGGQWPATETWVPGLGDGLIGLAAGVALGTLVAAGWWAGSRGRGWPHFAPVAMLAAIGIVLGWQRVALLAPLLAAVLLVQVAVARIACRTAVIPLAWFPAILATLWATEWFTLYDPALGLNPLSAQALGAATATLLLAAAAGAIAPPQYFALRVAEKPTFVALAESAAPPESIAAPLSDANVPEATHPEAALSNGALPDAPADQSETLSPPPDHA